jgi:hypothetical protein
MNVNKPKIDPKKPFTKALEVMVKAREPDEAEFQKIRPYLKRDFSPDDLYIREMYLANDQVDRSFEKFDSGYLDKFCKTIIGKSVLLGHDHKGAGMAKFFDCRIATDEKGWQWIVPSFYMPKNESNKGARDNIDSGVWDYVSIGFRGDYKGLICNICNRGYYDYEFSETSSEGSYSISASYCTHIAGKTYDGKLCTLTWDSTKSDMSKVEAVEGSIVYLGCQYDAAIAKSAEQSKERQEQKQQWLNDSGQSGQEHNKTPEKEDGMKTVEELEAALKTANEETDQLKEKVSQLEPLAKDGEAYREHLKAEVMRVGAIVGDGASAKLITESVTDTAKLKEVLEAYEKRIDTVAPPAGKGVPGTAEKPETEPIKSSGDYSLI